MIMENDSIQICPTCGTGGHYSTTVRQDCPVCGHKKMRKLTKTQKAFYLKNGCYCESWFRKLRTKAPTFVWNGATVS